MVRFKVSHYRIALSDLFWSTLLSTRKNYKCDTVGRSPASNDKRSDALNKHIHGSMGRGPSQFFNIWFVTTIYNTVYTYYMIRCFRKNLLNEHTHELFNVYASYILFKLNEITQSIEKSGHEAKRPVAAI